MSVSQITIDNPSGLTEYINSDVDVVSGVKASSGTIYNLIVDNTANAAVTYLKLWDVAVGSVTLGTTSPDYVLKIPASVKRVIHFPEGLAFGTALTVAATTTGLLAGATAPTSAVSLSITYA